MRRAEDLTDRRRDLASVLDGPVLRATRALAVEEEQSRAAARGAGVPRLPRWRPSAATWPPPRTPHRAARPGATLPAGHPAVAPVRVRPVPRGAGRAARAWKRALEACGPAATRGRDESGTRCAPHAAAQRRSPRRDRMPRRRSRRPSGPSRTSFRARQRRPASTPSPSSTATLAAGSPSGSTGRSRSARCAVAVPTGPRGSSAPTPGRPRASGASPRSTPRSRASTPRSTASTAPSPTSPAARPRSRPSARRCPSREVEAAVEAWARVARGRARARGAARRG